jgi:hypothetical protein
MRTFILATIVAVPACLATVEDDPEPGVLAYRPIDLDEHREELAIEAPPPKNGCDDFIAVTGPCSVACDPDALQQFIPKGTCVTFRCDRIDGTFGKYGGCRP